jgi:hypothetical protein
MNQRLKRRAKMRSKRFWILPLILLSLGSMRILAQASTLPSKPDSTPVSPQVSQTYTEAQVVQALKVGIQAALDKAVPLAVQAAVAQKEGERAAAQSLADQWKAEALKQYQNQIKADALAFGLGVVGTLVVGELIHLAIR